MLETTFLIHHLHPPATSASSSIRLISSLNLVNGRFCTEHIIVSLLQNLPVQVEIFKQKDKLFIAPLVPFSYHQTIKQISYHH